MVEPIAVVRSAQCDLCHDGGGPYTMQAIEGRACFEKAS